MLAIDAIVVKISAVRPRVVEAAFRCCNGNCEAIQMIYQSNEQELINMIKKIFLENTVIIITVKIFSIL